MGGIRFNVVVFLGLTAIAPVAHAEVTLEEFILRSEVLLNQGLADTESEYRELALAQLHTERDEAVRRITNEAGFSEPHELSAAIAAVQEEFLIRSEGLEGEADRPFTRFYFPILYANREDVPLPHEVYITVKKHKSAERGKVEGTASGLVFAATLFSRIKGQMKPQIQFDPIDPQRHGFLRAIKSARNALRYVNPNAAFQAVRTIGVRKLLWQSGSRATAFAAALALLDFIRTGETAFDDELPIQPMKRGLETPLAITDVAPIDTNPYSREGHVSRPFRRLVLARFALGIKIKDPERYRFCGENADKMDEIVRWHQELDMNPEYFTDHPELKEVQQRCVIPIDISLDVITPVLKKWQKRGSLEKFAFES